MTAAGFLPWRALTSGVVRSAAGQPPPASTSTPSSVLWQEPRSDWQSLATQEAGEAKPHHHHLPDSAPSLET